MAEGCTTQHLPAASTNADIVPYLGVYDRELKAVKGTNRVTATPYRRIALRPQGRRLPEGVGSHRSASCIPATSGQAPV